MGERLKGKTAIILGGTSKVGPEISRRLAEEGANVAIHYHSNREKAANAAEAIRKNGGNVEIFQANGTDEDSMNALMAKVAETFGSIDILVNLSHSYAAVSDKNAADLTWDDWSLHLDALKTHFLMCKSAIPYMRKQHFGRIIFISGGLAYRFYKGCSAYSCVKAGLNAFCKTVALEEGENNILVNIVSPGKIVSRVKTAEDLAQNRVYDEDTNAKCPLGRFATPEDVAKAVLFFASPESDGITGQTLYVSGGEIMPMP